MLLITVRAMNEGVERIGPDVEDWTVEYRFRAVPKVLDGAPGGGNGVAPKTVTQVSGPRQ
ncbi:hypothetical protein ACIBO6_35605 [Streptomyces luteogriseus]|uniref:hypothetical protein n=1 Tax=Streptomyces luteogriseus TaxID=68233 RepID=UPI0037992798